MKFNGWKDGVNEVCSCFDGFHWVILESLRSVFSLTETRSVEDSRYHSGVDAQTGCQVAFDCDGKSPMRSRI